MFFISGGNFSKPGKITSQGMLSCTFFMMHNIPRLYYYITSVPFVQKPNFDILEAFPAIVNSSMGE